MLNRIIERISSYKYAPLILLAVCIISYGLLTPLIGFFLDDWYLIWFKHTFGSFQFINYFQLDRPLEGYFYIIANFILGNAEKPIVWQLFGVFARWLSVAALWQMLNTIWPEARRQNLQAALLAAVFPGFTQQWVAAIYSFLFVCLAGFFFSVTLMLKAIRNRKRFWLNYLFSILIMAYVIPASEFFVGLELTRFLILFFEFKSEKIRFGKRLSKTVVAWLPYLLITSVFIIWRTFFFNSVNHPLEIEPLLESGFGNFVTNLIRQIYQAVVDAVINSWANPFNLNNFPASGIMANLILILSIIVFIALFGWLRKIDKKDNQPEIELDLWRKQAPWLALISMILSTLIFISADLPIDYQFPLDRLLLPFIFGSSLLVVWILEATKLNSLKNTLLISLLVTVALGYQVSFANKFKNMWATQKNFYWQFIWRVPNLEEGSTVIAYDLPDDEYWSGHSLTAFLNWTYADEVVDRKIKYQFILLDTGQKELIPQLKPNEPFNVDFRTYSFEGNTSKSIFVYYATDGCLRVLDSHMNAPEFVVDKIIEPRYMGDARVNDIIAGARLTDIDLIFEDSNDANHPPEVVLGEELAHNWCYYFERAAFKHQNADYQSVIDDYSTATNLGYSPLNHTEVYIFIDSLARTGQWDQAETLTMALLPTDRTVLTNGLCYVWSTLQTDFPGNPTPAHVINTLACQSYP